jgi:nucleoside-diphosphate-sugar epimerase
VFVADIGRARTELGWQPRVPVDQGISLLHAWVVENRALFAVPE